MGPLRSSIKLHLWLIDLFLVLYLATDVALEMKYLDITCAQARALDLFFSVAIAVLGASLSAHVLITGGIYAEEQPDEPPPLEEGGIGRQKSDPALALQPNQPSPDEEDVHRQKDDPALALFDFLSRYGAVDVHGPGTFGSVHRVSAGMAVQVKSPPESNITFKDYYGDLSNSRSVLQPSSQSPTGTRGSL
ncbi:hypothetical protein KC318_g2616 [Hortaea werneckii]|nr:hypothetical protein KC334_g2823 [Hortaea werneckii]KAI7020729.1 hypothetical protein KC355_g2627 [Hortaea werneckii]KAI7198207.1 hypothetical protein KC324_g3925 [Hortaea werneckii]KAI7586309.1 hypothetical protein KC316_g5676 [Hortaea werneckii]KAI7672814.1 hypothetical protein KC318_g2616 [Hortaea werneckii]